MWKSHVEERFEELLNDETRRLSHERETRERWLVAGIYFFRPPARMSSKDIEAGRGSGSFVRDD